jgi:putative PIN family toxin of toxin-antitoxin system
MRIVVDTNVLARAVRGGIGPAAELLGILMVPPHVFILSPFVLAELARVLRYPRMRLLHKLDDAQLDAYAQSLQTAALIVNPPAATTTQVVSADPDDDPVVTTAVHGQAEVLCTRDHHLHGSAVKAYCSNHGIQVLTDIEVLQILRAAASPPAP